MATRVHGPPSRTVSPVPRHTAKCNELTRCAAVGGVSHGSGRGDSKAAARESAARAAVAELRRKLAERGRI